MADGSPTRSQILEASGDMLKWQVYAIHTFPENGMVPVMENIGPHLAHQAKMEEDGVYIAAGPHWADDEETWEGEGLIIVRARDLAHAREIAESDPMHASGARSFRVRPWLINEGTITVKVNFASGAREVF
ncbi:MAG: hypothetical protein CMM26_04885 [Rhodospirillaceae bacterium]|nr:hypothetical protein [Rhodospirillaceae bacterium]|tara:strand:- start:743 stop:1135 length:393 start_codon:yes stop_codon:yes gene_type:complete